MDHYKVLGLSKTATKDQIKQAFRNLALQFHPDKHSLSPKSVREDATRKFKQASEAYDILIDDKKRAFYNNSVNSNQNYGYRGNGSSSYGYGGRSNSTNSSGYGSYGNGGQNYYRKSSNVSRFEVLFRYMGTRDFLIKLVFAGGLLGASHLISSGGEALWKMRNSGKSFEEVMETKEKTKAVKYEKI